MKNIEASFFPDLNNLSKNLHFIIHQHINPFCITK